MSIVKPCLPLWNDSEVHKPSPPALPLLALLLDGSLLVSIHIRTIYPLLC